MLLQSIPIQDLQPAPYNPRLTLKPGDKRWKKLERSLREFDLVQPIVWNKRTGHIVGGHQRCEVLRHSGITEVDCVVVDLPLNREKALNVALNNSEVGGDWDASKLMSLVVDLQTAPDIDPTLTGFDEHQLRGMQFEPALPPGDEQDTPPPSNHVIATLDIPYVRWATVRAWLDDLLGEEDSIRLHVKLPNATPDA